MHPDWLCWPVRGMLHLLWLMVGDNKQYLYLMPGRAGCHQAPPVHLVLCPLTGPGLRFSVPAPELWPGPGIAGSLSLFQIGAPILRSDLSQPKSPLWQPSVTRWERDKAQRRQHTQTKFLQSYYKVTI